MKGVGLYAHIGFITYLSPNQSFVYCFSFGNQKHTHKQETDT